MIITVLIYSQISDLILEKEKPFLLRMMPDTKLWKWDGKNLYRHSSPQLIQTSLNQYLYTYVNVRAVTLNSMNQMLKETMNKKFHW